MNTYVTSADADVGDANDHVVGIFDYRERSVFEAGVSRAIE